MKLITAVVTPEEFDAVKNALNTFDVAGLTITEVYQRDLTGGRDQVYRGQRFHADLLPHIRIDLVATDRDIIDLLHIMTKVAPRVGGAESLWVTPVEVTVRIRTGERGADAL